MTRSLPARVPDKEFPMIRNELAQSTAPFIEFVPAPRPPRSSMWTGARWAAGYMTLPPGCRRLSESTGGFISSDRSWRPGNFPALSHPSGPARRASRPNSHESTKSSEAKPPRAGMSSGGRWQNLTGRDVVGGTGEQPNPMALRNGHLNDERPAAPGKRGRV